MILMGVDPGVKGAIALYNTSDRSLVVHDMPDTTAALYELIMGLVAVDHCMIEKPYYPKIIGINNAVKIAEAYGRIKTVLFAKGIPVFETRPAEWKAVLGLSSNKAASREKAGQFFPDYTHIWARVKDDGRAEAALLAWFAMGAKR